MSNREMDALLMVNVTGGTLGKCIIWPQSGAT